MSIAIEASYNWLYCYRILEEIADNITVAHPLKTNKINPNNFTPGAKFERIEKIAELAGSIKF
ncbi:MAG: hypothetical protein KJ770_03280 [Actinobacteria bacterium]|nr:hypothetical protein [Actinomycetota bacterium]MCG2789307.1 hypothetical protein [Actinomycetes bacterium]